MNRGVPFGTALRAFSRAVGHGERRPIVDAEEGRPALPDADSSNLSGWLQNFGARFRNTSDVPHEGPTYNPGMEQFATDTLFPGSGTAGMRPDPTPEEIAASRAAIGQFGRDVFFGPERESVLPFVDDASDPERLIRDWGLSEQEFRLSGRAFSEGRLGAGSGWGALGIMAAVPVVGWTGRGLAKLGRATLRGATAGADTAPVLRAARTERAVPEELRALDELDARWRDGQFEVGFDDPRRLELVQDLGARLEEFSQMWGSDFDFIRNYQQITGEILAGGNPAIPFDLWIGLRAIEHGPLTSAPVYRGLSMAPEELAQIAVGSGYALPPSSFTYARGEALDFMSIRTSGQPVMLVVEEGASALPIGAIWQGAGLGEVVSNGLFEVAAINRVTTGAGARGREIAVKHGEYTEITLRQVEPIRVSPEPGYKAGKFEDVAIVNADEIAGRVDRIGSESARLAADASPISRMFEGGAAPTPVSQTDSDLFRILSDDAIIPSTDRAPFQVAQVSRAQASADVQASAQSFDVALSPMHLIERLRAGSARGSERQFRRDMGVDDSIDIPASVERALVDKYENSFIRVDPAFDPLTEASEMLSAAANHMQWETPALLTGRQGTVRREPLYSPTEGILDPNVSLSYGSADPIELWEIAGAISGRAKTYQDTHNRIVSDRMLQDLAEEGIGVGTARFGAQEAELLADAMRSFDMRPTVAVPGSALQRVFDDGAILNQYMTLSSSGALAPDARVITELQVMGIAPMIGPTGRPVYGYVSVAGPQRDAFSGSLNDILRDILEKGHVLSVGRPAGYGEVHFVFGKETANSSLFTLGDSLHSPVIARPLSNPSAADAGLASGPFLDSIVRRPSDLRVTGTPPTARFGRQSYVEAHVTQPNFRDVTEIHINEGPYTSTQRIEDIRGTMKALTGNDVDIYILRERQLGAPDNIVTYDSYLVEPGGRVSTVSVG